ncbi:sigma-70 family RNA polymerase sigma factor [Streptomyces sp. NA04227]|uniref:RNA polymerase sigma factor n=1 Tax=Streptomyces sp. NA04227 TaxID=2742136 RepID=UPI0015907216|nr:sigma-70 family RNA polymerase sigma factor [Streptomyces sp. NA04227]QKW08115.1 sigma-70 family RNA polymerase sigma factor [Streptomyces sp. NA04227]
MDAAVAAAVAEAHRRQWGFVLGATLRITRDLDLAEECVQEAYTQALTQWVSQGIPERPEAWLTLVARRRAVDVIRRHDTLRGKLPLLAEEETAPAADQAIADQDIPDDRLRIIFICCHPLLDVDTRVGLTLRLVCGLSTAEVARALLVSEQAMAARITRGKKKIKAARIPYREPEPEELPARVDAVLDVVHLIFSTGHTAPSGDQLQRRDLVSRATHLARILHQLLPAESGPAGLLALILLIDARRYTRTRPDGALIPLSEQDRTLWDTTQIGEGRRLVTSAMRHRPPNRYALMAAIAAVHAQAGRWEDTDWRQIVGLYDALLLAWPSPVVALNRAIAIGQALGPAAGLEALDELASEPKLAQYHYFAAARADFLRRLHRLDEALASYHEALSRTENAVEREFLEARLKELGAGC